MGSGVDESQFVPFPPATVWPALRQAITANPALKIERADERLLRIDFKSGMSAFTSGQRMSASIAPDPAGGSRVTVGGVGKMPTQIGTQSRLKKLIAEVFGAMSRALPVDPPDAASASTGPSVADELRKLADLRAEGVLSEAEFEAQKSRLLGG